MELAKVVKQVSITAKEQPCGNKTDVLSEVCKSKCNHRILSHDLTVMPREKRKELKRSLKGDRRFPGMTTPDQRREGRLETWSCEKEASQQFRGKFNQNTNKEGIPKFRQLINI